MRWFSPGVLASSGLRVVLSAVFGAFLDKRELQAVTGSSVFTDLAAQDEGVWIDYLSDTGDGFVPTYTMAWLLARPALDLAGAPGPLPRGEVLVLGGDEVYPTASPTEYEDRFLGPFSAALPWLPADGARPPSMFVLAGNHDWYDGLTAFIRTFCQNKWVGAWKTSQTRSYFALQLPHRWWLWGIDIQLDSYIDEPQLRFFEEAAAKMTPGDRVILCTAKPSWVETAEEPEAFRNLAYLERALIRPVGARLMLTLTGDNHHYARYEGTAAMGGTHKITAGGGGAFLHPTHDLPSDLSLKVDKRDETPQRFVRRACYPEMGASRRMSFRALALPLLNPSFMAVPAVGHFLLLWIYRPPARVADRVGLGDVVSALQRSPAALALSALVLGGLIGFAKPPARWQHGRVKLLAKAAMGVAHGALQLAALLAVAWVSIRIASIASGMWFTLLLVVLVLGLGGLAGGLAMGGYLTVCNATPSLDTHGNEAFSAQRLSSHKNFVRFHIDGEGVLRLYAVGVERAVERWRPDPEAGPSASWLAPDGDPPRAHLIEGPIVIDGR